MAFFEWNESLSVGLESVDRQHRGLIDCINDLEQAVSAGSSGDSVRTIMQALRNYTRVHFAYEEGMFRVYAYAEAADHAAGHRAFVTMIEDCERRHAAGDTTVAAQLLGYLKSWLREHILVEDMAYAAVLRERGAR